MGEQRAKLICTERGKDIFQQTIKKTTWKYDNNVDGPHDMWENLKREGCINAIIW